MKQNLFAPSLTRYFIFLVTKFVMLNEGYVLYFVRPIMVYIVNKLFYEKHSQPKNCHFVFGSNEKHILVMIIITIFYEKHSQVGNVYSLTHPQRFFSLSHKNQ
jgi:hypothetical protein